MAQLFFNHFNVPALLRALADVSQEVPYVRSQIQMSPGADEIVTLVREVDTTISMTHVLNIENFAILFALAYEKHGGDPLLLISRQEHNQAKGILDANSWVLDRLPTEDDGNIDGEVKIPSRTAGSPWVWQHHTLIVPGQPWAQWDAKPGPYQP